MCLSAQIRTIENHVMSPGPYPRNIGFAIRVLSRDNRTGSETKSWDVGNTTVFKIKDQARQRGEKYCAHIRRKYDMKKKNPMPSRRNVEGGTFLTGRNLEQDQADLGGGEQRQARERTATPVIHADTLVICAKAEGVRGQQVRGQLCGLHSCVWGSSADVSAVAD